jgi:hypothetical protein
MMSHYARTLRLSRLPGHTLALAVPLLAIVCALAEMICRQPAVTAFLPAPGLGIAHGNFENKLIALDAVAQDEPVDCFFLGSSVVLNSLIPSVVEDAYRAQTGETIHCFNFGVAATTASWSGEFADYLIATYHPRLLVYVVSPRDFSPAAVEKGYTRAALDQDAWMRYQRGRFTPEGWLIVNSAAYRRYLPVSGWMLPDFRSRLDSRRDTQAQFIARRGYEPEPGQLVLPLSDNEIARVSALFSDWQPVAAEWDGLRHIVALHDVTQVVLVEIPLNPLVIADYLGEDAYQQFNARIAADAVAQGVLYWPTSPLDLIPDPAWANANHVNNGGARLFSQWFGARLGQAVDQGQLTP